jgi:hypothetical protein
MHATVSTWRIHESISTTVERDDLVRDLLANGIEIVRRAGVLDVMMIEVDPDLLMIVSVFETLEEANAAGELTPQFVADNYSGKLELVNRVTDRAYDPPRIVGLNRLDSRLWRGEAEAMHANLVTWRLDPSILSPESLGAHLRGVWENFSPLLLQIGLLDVLVVRTSEDTMLAIRLYADRQSGDAAYDQAVRRLGTEYTSKVSVVEKAVGRAFDVPQLLNRPE